MEGASLCLTGSWRYHAGRLHQVTRMLGEIARGDAASARQLLPMVYEELRRAAGQLLAGERSDHTLQATALVHEAYLRLIGGGQDQQAWAGRGHFFAAAAEAMRRVLVDSARRRNAQKRGGGVAVLRLDTDGEVPGDCAAPGDATQSDDEETLAVDAALEKLAAHDPAKAELVKLRYFAGLSEEEAAAVLGISRATASRHWTYSRAWLRSEIQGTNRPAADSASGS